MTNLYIFRHGETDWNSSKRLQGHTDIPLNDKGRLQALRLMEYFKELPVEAIISSDLSRAKETAEVALASKGIPINQSKNLREVCLGEFEGRYRSEIKATPEWQSWIDYGQDDFSFPNGESKKECRKRIDQHIRTFLSENPVTHLAISTHGGVLARALELCENGPGKIPKIRNCALFHLKIEKGQYFLVETIHNSKEN